MQDAIDSSPTSAVALDRIHAMYVDHAAAIHAYASRRVGADVADDVLAETFRRAIESLDRFDDRLGSERGWLFGIATNVLFRHRRTEMRRLRATARAAAGADAGSDPVASVAGAVDAGDELDRVLTAVADLSEDDLALLVLVAWERMSSAEVAEALGIAPGTVRSRLHRIRTTLDRSRSTNTRGDDDGHHR